MDPLSIVLSVGGPLVGVLIGAWLTRRQGESDWIRERRADLYIELMDLLNSLLDLAATDRKALKYSGSAAAIRRDIDEVWKDMILKYNQNTTCITILGGEVSRAFNLNAATLILNLTEVYEDPSADEGMYEAVLLQGQHFKRYLEQIAQYDLGNMTWSRRRMLRKGNFGGFYLTSYRDGDFIDSDTVSLAVARRESGR
jgi:hypothetical protein